MYRQGDVLLKEIPSIPASAVAVEGPVILALGETTGHSHRFKDDSGVRGFYKSGAEDHTMAGGSEMHGGVLIGESTGLSYISVPQGGADLLHVGELPKGHDPIPVAPRDYEVIRQREHVGPGIARRVVD